MKREGELTELLEEFHIAHLRKAPSISLSGGERRFDCRDDGAVLLEDGDVPNGAMEGSLWHGAPVRCGWLMRTPATGCVKGAPHHSIVMKLVGVSNSFIPAGPLCLTRMQAHPAPVGRWS